MLASSILALISLAASVLWTPNDPFVGKWKLDASRSLVVDQIQVERAGQNTFRLLLTGADHPETIVADGTFQPGVFGTTLALTPEGPRGLKVERRKDGRTLLVAHWKLSDDGRTLHDDFTAMNPDGTAAPTDHLSYPRKSGRSGFVGLWQRTTPPEFAYELQIQPHGDHGLSFIVQGAPKDVTFDGRDHAVPGAGATASGQRPSERAMEVTDKTNGKVTTTRSYKLSRDGKTLTVLVRPFGQTTPNVLVLERE